MTLRTLLLTLLVLALALPNAAAQEDDPVEVMAGVETAPAPHEGDAADDAALWVHPDDPALSVIIGTDKRGGVAVYELTGEQRQYIDESERMNNVDLRYNFLLDGEQVALVAVSNRRGDRITFYRVDPAARELVNVTARDIDTDIDIYGLCMYRSAKTGTIYVFVNGEEGEIQQWEPFDDGAGIVDARLVREFSVDSQPEGCVADDELGYFYIGEEDVAIWRFDAEPDAPAEPTMIAAVRADAPDPLEADVEGMTIYYAADGAGYLIASSQGSDDYAVFERAGENRYLGRFEIADGETIDGTSGTDGIDVSNVALGDAFPEGVFIAQDNNNTDPDGNQNFKLVPWGEIAHGLDLTIDTTWDPRAAGAPAE